jgi:hypothetical protein
MKGEYRIQKAGERKQLLARLISPEEVVSLENGRSELLSYCISCSRFTFPASLTEFAIKPDGKNN